eukprot:2364289-Pleurochrysis_carterae.AAC.3
MQYFTQADALIEDEGGILSSEMEATFWGGGPIQHRKQSPSRAHTHITSHTHSHMDFCAP